MDITPAQRTYAEALVTQSPPTIALGDSAPKPGSLSEQDYPGLPAAGQSTSSTGGKTKKASRQCDSCNRFISTVDPHTSCYLCRDACSDANRCTDCASLSDRKFGKYREYVSKRANALQAQVDRMVGGESLPATTPTSVGGTSAVLSESEDVPVRETPKPAPRTRTVEHASSSAQMDNTGAQQAVKHPEPAGSLDALALLIQRSVDAALALREGPADTSRPRTPAPSEECASVSADGDMAEDQAPDPGLVPEPLATADRVGMVLEILGISRPTPEPDVSIRAAVAHPAKGKRNDEYSLPQATLLQPLKGLLDDRFASATLNVPPVSVPRWSKSSFPVWDPAYAGKAPTAESHVEQFQVGHPNVTLTQAQVSEVDNVARHGLQALSHADRYSEAAAVLLDENGDSRDRKVYECLVGVGESLQYLAGALAWVSSQATYWRRQAYLNAANTLGDQRREELSRQPWSSGTLFNNKVKPLTKEQKADDNAESHRRSVELLGSVVQQQQRGRGNANFQPAKPAASHTVAAPPKSKQANKRSFQDKGKGGGGGKGGGAKRHKGGPKKDHKGGPPKGKKNF